MCEVEWDDKDYIHEPSLQRGCINVTSSFGFGFDLIKRRVRPYVLAIYLSSALVHHDYLAIM